MISIQRREWTWLVVWSLIILLFVTLPHIYGSMISTPDNQYSGFVIGIEDGNSYLAKMRQGYSGNWLFHLTYTSEDHPRALFFGQYLLLGNLARAFDINLQLMLRLGWAAGLLFELVSFYCFTAYFTTLVSVRRLAFLFFGFAAGFGWLWLLLGYPADLGQMPIDVWVPDTSFFLAALASPHMGAAHGFMLWFIIGTLAFLQNPRFKYWLLAGSSGLLSSLILPYKLGVPGVLLGLYWLWMVYRYHQPFWQGVWRLVLVILPSLPYLVYGIIVLQTNTIFQIWRLQSPDFTPYPQYLMLGLGLLLPLALIGLWQLRRSTFKHRAFLVIWVVVVPVLVYLPTLIQRRFLHGYQVPLAILGAVGLLYLVGRIPRFRVPVIAGVLLTMALTNVFLLVGALTTVAWHRPPVFQPGSQIEAFTWLSDNSEEPVILANFDTGNVLLVYVSGRVFLGHGLETVDSKTKQQHVKQFFQKATSDSWRQKLLTDYNLSYLYYGPNEQALGDFDPADAPYLDQVYENDTVRIFEVKN